MNYKNTMAAYVANMVLTMLNNVSGTPKDMIIVIPKRYSLQMQSQTYDSHLLRDILYRGVSQKIVDDNFIKLKNGILLMNGDINICGDPDRGIIVPYKLMKVQSKNKLSEFLKTLTNRIPYKYISRYPMDFGGDGIWTYEVCRNTSGYPTAIESYSLMRVKFDEF